MYLRRVEAYGFKSFADRLVFEFGPGITTVVGPNGSGKSNVSDAIRWALGEQSPRAMRARKTEDLIFSGSDQRAPLGVAEVTLILDNSEHWMPIDFDEVSITRRAYRSGENEYRINGQKVRLLDVHDLFLRAQVGQNSYAMMSQGLVDEVLGLRPVERRQLIEEAADVHRHRVELNRAERRLTQTRDNLGHVRVMIRELSPRLRQLERQSERAARFRELDGQLSAALEAYYETELRLANEALAAARATHDQRAEAFAAAQRTAGAFAPGIAAAARAVADARAELDRTQRRERELAEQALALGQQLALAEQRRELLLVRRGEVESSLEELEGAPELEAPERDDGTVALDARVAESEAELERAREGMRAADDAVRGVLRELAEAEARRIRLEAELADLERQRERERGRRRTLERQREAALARRDELRGTLRGYGREALAAQRTREALAEAATEAQRRREVSERRLEEAQSLTASAREALRDASAERERLQARRDLFATLSASVADRASAAQELLRAAREPDEGSEPLRGVVGLVSRLIRVPRGLEHAIEAALAEQLSAVVVERQEDALAAIEHLRERGAGTVTLLPRDSIPHQYPLNLFNERGVVGVAARLVKVDKEHRPLVDTLLGRTIVVDDLPTALKTVKRGLGSVVTRDGLLVRSNGSIYGGSRGAVAEQFVLQEEADALPGAIEEAERAEDAAAARVQRLDDAAADVRAAVAAARRGVEQAEAERREHERQSARLRRRLVAISGELRLVHAALAADASATASADPSAIEARRAGLTALAAEIARLRDRSEAVDMERDAAGEQVAAAAAAGAAAQGEREAARARHAAAEEELRRSRERLAERRDQALAIRRELEDIELSMRNLREQLANVQSAHGAAEEAVAPAHAALAEAETAERELAATRGDSQAQLFAAERELLEAQSSLRELATRVQTLEQQLADDGLTVDQAGTVRRQNGARPALPAAEADAETEAAAAVALATPPAQGGAEVDRAELRERISELRGEIRALGPVNVQALEDLSEERERHDFLQGQVDDLEAAEAQLREAIHNLEQRIRERFDEIFGEVNASFGEYFRRFFGGGRAELIVVEPEEKGGERGVDVRAQPPGKRISSLAMLSGGERALTSVALLFSLLAVNPAPVCVLDEVDAALDDINVGRFVETLRELCDRSQFIVITHNRATIEAADTIYGVSMGDDSVSRVLSLRLADLPQAS